MDEWEWESCVVEKMIGGAQMSVEKLEAQFTRSAGVKVHIWMSKI